ncbi:MAG: DUF6265 family protein [Planctomycetota bacterium]
MIRATICFLLSTVCLTASGVAQETGETKSPAASIDQVQWIAGNWSGTAMGGKFEETWSPPSFGAMMGMFKFIKDDKIAFYELLTIVPKEESLIVRLKHFDDQLVGWEEKDESVEFPLVSISETEAKFDGLRFNKISKNEMHITVRIGEGDQAEDVKFICKRVIPTQSK